MAGKRPLVNHVDTLIIQRDLALGIHINRGQQAFHVVL